MKYIHRLEFQDPQSYDVAVASTIDEIKHLAEAGFQNSKKQTEYTFTGDQKDTGPKKYNY